MAILSAGAWGKLRGKLGGIVLQTWKGLNTAREYVIPSNPKTPKQVFQRARMSYIGVFCGLIKDMAGIKFWKQYENNTTALSECSRTNINAQPPFVDEVTPFVPDPTKRITSRGNLEAAAFDGDPTYSTGDGALSVPWVPDTVGNGAPTDKAYVQIVDQDNLVSLANDTAIRSDNELLINIGAGRDATKIFIFVTMYRELTTGIFNSLGAGKVCTTP